MTIENPVTEGTVEGAVEGAVEGTVEGAMEGTVEGTVQRGGKGKLQRYYLASTYLGHTNDIIEPFWKYDQLRHYETEKQRWGGRSECLASATNVCTMLYPYYGRGHEMCKLGLQAKQGTLPAPIRAAAVRLGNNLEESNGGLAYALGYRMPLCPSR